MTGYWSYLAERMEIDDFIDVETLKDVRAVTSALNRRGFSMKRLRLENGQYRVWKKPKNNRTKEIADRNHKIRDMVAAGFKKSIVAQTMGVDCSTVSTAIRYGFKKSDPKPVKQEPIKPAIETKKPPDYSPKTNEAWAMLELKGHKIEPFGKDGLLIDGKPTNAGNLVKLANKDDPKFREAVYA